MFTPPTASDACGTATVQQVSDITTTQGTNTLYTRCWRAVDACSNTSGTVCQTVTRPLGPWTITGFYQPVDMINGVVNTIKGGSTVPLKFNIYAGGVERTSVSDVQGGTARLSKQIAVAAQKTQWGIFRIQGQPPYGMTLLATSSSRTGRHQRELTIATVVRMTAIDGSVIDSLLQDEVTSKRNNSTPTEHQRREEKSSRRFFFLVEALWTTALVGANARCGLVC